jgi:hypothetical protein
MEKLPRSTSIKVPKVRLYLDDIEDLIGIFERIGTDNEFVIGEYRLNDGADLRNIPIPSASTLNFTSSTPNVSLDLRPGGGDIHATANSGTLGRGMANELFELLRVCPDAVRGLVAAIGSGVGFALVFASVLACVVAAVEGLWLATVVFGCLFLIGTAWTVWSWNEGQFHHARIVLKRKEDAPGYFRRNSDSLVTSLVTGVIGIVVGAILTKILDL